MKKYKIIIFGCLFNKSDAEKASAVLEKIGYTEALSEKEADLIMVLACSVRQAAIDRIYGLKKKFAEIKKQRPLITILSGCILASDQKKMADFFDLIFDIKNLSDLPHLLEAKSYKLKAISYFNIHPSYNSKFEAYVPIMTGCNNFCSYCVVPYVRGREVSRPAEEVIKECKDLIRKGYKQITLLGQNVNSYGKKTIKQENKKSIENFSDLLKAIDAIEGKYWLSFMTSHPKDLSDELIKVMAKSKHIIPYLHLPIQSGDNEILEKMNRKYTVAHYKTLIKKVRKVMPGIAISTDIIVGFPTETKKQFANTAKLFPEIKFDMAYLAQYSPRVGTAAAKLTDDVSKIEKKKRWEELNQLLKFSALQANKKLLNKTVEVLVEDFKKNKAIGKTDTLKKVIFESDQDLSGSFAKVKITKIDSWGLFGKLIK